MWDLLKKKMWSSSKMVILKVPFFEEDQICVCISGPEKNFP